MTVTTKPIVQTQYAVNAQTTVYTVPSGTRTLIDKVSGYNSDTAVQTLAFNLVPSGGSAGGSNLVIYKSLAAGESYLFPEVVGHTLAAGDFVSTLASVASKIVVRISAREVT